jgi:hypothetical protein
MFLRKSNNNFGKTDGSHIMSHDQVNSTQAFSGNESRVMIFHEPPQSTLSKSINFENIRSQENESKSSEA